MRGKKQHQRNRMWINLYYSYSFICLIFLLKFVYNINKRIWRTLEIKNESGSWIKKVGESTICYFYQKFHSQKIANLFTKIMKKKWVTLFLYLFLFIIFARIFNSTIFYKDEWDIVNWEVQAMRWCWKILSLTKLPFSIRLSGSDFEKWVRPRNFQHSFIVLRFCLLLVCNKKLKLTMI